MMNILRVCCFLCAIVLFGCAENQASIPQGTSTVAIDVWPASIYSGGLPPYPNITKVNFDRGYVWTSDEPQIVADWYINQIEKVGGNIIFDDRRTPTAIRIRAITPSAGEIYVTIAIEDGVGLTAIVFDDIPDK
jgi:hypothetical protein